MSLRAISFSAFTLAILSGCQLAPQQEALNLPVPDAYASETGDEQVKMAAVF